MPAPDTTIHNFLGKLHVCSPAGFPARNQCNFVDKIPANAFDFASKEYPTVHHNPRSSFVSLHQARGHSASLRQAGNQSA